MGIYVACKIIVVIANQPLFYSLHADQMGIEPPTLLSPVKRSIHRTSEAILIWRIVYHDWLIQRYMKRTIW